MKGTSIQALVLEIKPMTALLPPNMCQTKLFDGTLMNLRFDPSGVAGEKGLEIIESVIREYVQHDGQHIQLPYEGELEIDSLIMKKMREEYGRDPLDVEAMMAYIHQKP